MTIEMLKRAVEVGGDSALVLLFRSAASAGKIVDDRIPFDPSIDSLECAVKLLYGDADLVITHADGGITVIVAKDGDRGHQDVAAAVGRVSLCAAQLALMLGPETVVRAALLWSSTGSAFLDALIEDACVRANVIPLSWSTTARHLAETAKCLNWNLSGAAHLADVHEEARGLH